MGNYPQCLLCDSKVTETCMKIYAGKKPPCARDIKENNPQKEPRGEWQKSFVNNLINTVGLNHSDAMIVMGLVCDLRQKAYIEGYERGSRNNT